MTISPTDTRFNAIKTNKTGLQNTSVTNGSVYFVADTKELFFDFDSQRVKVTDILILNTEEERTGILFSPLNKFYFVLATQKLYLYKDGTWYSVAGSGGGSIDIDDVLSLTSENPVQNKIITAELNNKIEADYISATRPILYNDSTGVISANIDTVVGTNSDYLITSGAVETAITNALVSGVVYKGTWEATGQTDYSSITKPVKKGWLYFVDGSTTINDIEWKTGDFLLINSNVTASGTITDVKKIDNTESTDIVRLNAAQIIINKTIDADDNTIQDLQLSNLKSGVLQTTIRNTTDSSNNCIVSEKAIAAALSNKQDTIANLATIQSGAALGATAVQPADLASAITNMQTTTNLVTSVSSSSTNAQYPSAKLLYDSLATKQATLISGTTIKTINNNSILGTGNIDISGSGSEVIIRDWSVSST